MTQQLVNERIRSSFKIECLEPGARRAAHVCQSGGRRWQRACFSLHFPRQGTRVRPLCQEMLSLLVEQRALMVLEQ